MGLENAPEDPVLNEQETTTYLKEMGNLPLEKWRVGEPVLCVLRDDWRDDTSRFNRYASMPRADRPTIARLTPESIDNKTEFDVGKASGKIVPILNKNMRVDYYVIDKKTRVPRLVRSTRHEGFYPTRIEAMYSADAALFPEGISDFLSDRPKT